MAIINPKISILFKLSPRKSQAIIAEVGGIRKKTETVLLAEFLLIKNIKIVKAPKETNNIWWLIAIIKVVVKSIKGFWIKKNSASKPVSVFFLIPPPSAIMAFVFLGENLNIFDIIGFLIATWGVYIATREKN